MLPRMGPTTGPNTAPMPHITRAVGWRCLGKVASRMAWPIGMIGAPNAPCATRARIRVSRLLAKPHSSEVTVKPSTVKNIRLRQPTRLASQPVIGVATAVATRLSVITQEISSCVADRLPRICGSTRLAKVMVMPNSMLASWTINRMSHCRPLIVKRPPFVSSAMAVIPGRLLDCCRAAILRCGNRSFARTTSIYRGNDALWRPVSCVRPRCRDLTERVTGQIRQN